MEEGGLTLPLLRADGIGFDCKAVLFDKDGTLIDFKDMWLEWSRYMLDEVSAAAGFKNGERDILERAMGIDLAAWHVDPDGPLAGGSMTGLRESMLQMLQTTGMDEDDAQLYRFTGGCSLPSSSFPTKKSSYYSLCTTV